MSDRSREGFKNRRASEIIVLLRNHYHYTNKRIAYEVGNFGYISPLGSKGVNQSTISRLANPDEHWSISDSLLDALEAVLSDEMGKNLGATLTLLPFEVIDFCGVPLEPNYPEQVENAVKSVLRSLPASPQINLPNGIDGVLVSLGEQNSNLYLIITDSDLDSSRKKSVAHELEHMAARLRDASNLYEDDDSSAEV